MLTRIAQEIVFQQYKHWKFTYEPRIKNWFGSPGLPCNKCVSLDPLLTAPVVSLCVKREIVTLPLNKMQSRLQ